MYIDGVHIDVYRQMAVDHARKMQELADKSCFGGTVLVRVDIRKKNNKYDAGIWTSSYRERVEKTNIKDTNGVGVVRYLNENGICVSSSYPVLCVMEDADAGDGTYIAINRGTGPYAFFQMMKWFTRSPEGSDELWDKVCNKLSSDVSYVHALTWADKSQAPFCDKRFVPGGKNEDDGYEYASELFYNERNWLTYFSLDIREKKEGGKFFYPVGRIDFNDPLASHGCDYNILEEGNSKYEGIGRSSRNISACALAKKLFKQEDPFLFVDRFIYSGTFHGLKVMVGRLIRNGAEQWDLGYDNAGETFIKILSAVTNN